jgi:hypothetical protein
MEDLRASMRRGTTYAKLLAVGEIDVPFGSATTAIGDSSAEPLARVGLVPGYPGDPFPVKVVIAGTRDIVIVVANAGTRAAPKIKVTKQTALETLWRTTEDISTNPLCIVAGK